MLPLPCDILYHVGFGKSIRLSILIDFAFELVPIPRLGYNKHY